MTRFDIIIDKVDEDLMQLINASAAFNEYKNVTSTTWRGNVSLKGSLGVEINPGRTLGVAITARG